MTYFGQLPAVQRLRDPPRLSGSATGIIGQDLPFPNTENPADAGFLIGNYRPQTDLRFGIDARQTSYNLRTFGYSYFQLRPILMVAINI